MRIEQIIFSALISQEPYTRKVLPFLKSDYFSSAEEKKLYTYIHAYTTHYNTIATKTILYKAIDVDDTLSDEQHETMRTIIDSLEYDEGINEQWLLDETEKFCQERAIYNAIMESISIIDGKGKDKTKEAIPEILSDALGVSFDEYIGHDFIENANERWLEYTEEKERIPFDLEMLNTVTKGGVLKKTLNVVVGGTAAGKTLAMCHFAASHLAQGLNVLYITLEIAEERIAERIDANLLDIDMEELPKIKKDVFEKKIEKLKTKTNGKLIIKEYPTGTAGCNHFRHLLNELNLKREFVPDVIFVDYMNLCISSRIKVGSNVNSYSYVKAIAEELRGLGVEFDVPLFSATQLNRSGFVSSDPGLEDTAESFGVPATADFMIGLISTPELEALNQIMVKQLKSRYGDPARQRKFVLGIDRPKMRLYDCEQHATDDLIDGGADEVDSIRRDVLDRSRESGGRFDKLFA